MNNFEKDTFYGYECRTGCGRKTISDKFYKSKCIHCSVCGEKSEMRYVGEFSVTQINQHKVDLGLSR